MSDFLDEVTTIKGRFVELRPVSGTDFPTLYRWRSSFASVHQLNFRRTVTTYETFVREIESMLPSSIMLLIRDAKTKDPIGYTLGYSVNAWDRHMGGSIFIDPSRRMRVYGGEALVLSIDFFFSLYPLNKIVVEPYEFAESLRDLLERMGFEECGVYPEHYWHDGRAWALHIMQMRRARWDVQREEFTSLLDSERFLTGYATNGSSAHFPEVAK